MSVIGHSMSKYRTLSYVSKRYGIMIKYYYTEL